MENLGRLYEDLLRSSPRSLVDHASQKSMFLGLVTNRYFLILTDTCIPKPCVDVLVEMVCRRRSRGMSADISIFGNAVRTHQARVQNDKTMTSSLRSKYRVLGRLREPRDLFMGKSSCRSPISFVSGVKSL